MQNSPQIVYFLVNTQEGFQFSGHIHSEHLTKKRAQAMNNI